MTAKPGPSVSTACIAAPRPYKKSADCSASECATLQCCSCLQARVSSRALGRNRSLYRHVKKGGIGRPSSSLNQRNIPGVNGAVFSKRVWSGTISSVLVTVPVTPEKSAAPPKTRFTSVEFSSFITFSMLTFRPHTWDIRRLNAPKENSNSQLKKGRGLLRARVCHPGERVDYLTSISWVMPTGAPLSVTSTLYLPVGHGVALVNSTLVVSTPPATTFAVCCPATWPSW